KIRACSRQLVILRPYHSERSEESEYRWSRFFAPLRMTLVNMQYIALIPYALVGTLLASTLALVPALHVYNVAGIFILLALRVQNLVSGDQLAMLLLGMIVGYAMLNTISAIFLGAPD